MKKRHHWVHTILRGTILVLTVALITLLIPKGYELLQYKQKQSQWKVRNQEVSVELAKVQSQIQTLSSDRQALQVFMKEEMPDAVIVEPAPEVPAEAQEQQQPEQQPEQVPEETQTSQEPQVQEQSQMPNTEMTNEFVEAMAGEAIIVEQAPPYVPPAPEENMGQEEPDSSGKAVESVSQNTVNMIGTMKEQGSELVDSVSQNAADQRAAQEEAKRREAEAAAAAAESISWNAVTGEVGERVETISGNGQDIPFEETISGNGQDISFEDTTPTLEDRRSTQSSFEETAQLNAASKAVLQESSVDFSERKIACLGDSLTAASNMDSMENYTQYSYPSVLKEVLSAKEVYNLGIGGSSYGRYWDKPFVERYQDIPKDVNVILVMGGANDGFAASSDELGSLQERKKGTFYGDVDELMRGLQKEYPNAQIVFATPLPNVLQDYLMRQRAYLLPQTSFVYAIKELAAEYGIDVIDLYNSNLLDTHDAQVISAYMPDGVHCNQEGYRILGEYLGSQLIQIMESKNNQQEPLAEQTL